jgi:predicted DNA binding CopG/RHH family protein
MRKSYNFSKSKKNPYTPLFKKQITIRLEIETLNYFKKMALEVGMPYQNLINLYLRDCVAHKRKPKFLWAE